MARTGGVEAVAEQPANKASALSFVAESKASPAAKKMASEAIESYSKQQTADFKEWWKLNVTDAKDDGNAQVESGRQALANSGFVDKAVISGAATELQGYEWKQNEREGERVTQDLYSQQKDIAEKMAPAAKAYWQSYADRNPEWAASVPGSKFIESKMQEIAAFEKDHGDGNMAAKFIDISRTLYRLKSQAMSGEGFNDSQTIIDTDTAVSEAYNRAVELGDASQIARITGEAESIKKLSIENLEKMGLSQRFAVSTSEVITSTMMNSMPENRRKEFLDAISKRNKDGTPLPDHIGLFLYRMNEYTEAKLSQIANTDKNKQMDLFDTFRLELAAETKKQADLLGSPAEHGIFDSVPERLADQFELLEGKELFVANKRTGTTAENPLVPSSKVKEIDTLAYNELKDWIGGARSITKLPAKTVNSEFEVIKSGPAGSTVKSVYRVERVKEGSNNRLILRNLADKNDIRYLDRELTPEEEKARQERIINMADNNSITNEWGTP